MAEVRLRRHSKIYSPAAQAGNETVTLFNVYKGDRIVFGDIQKRVLSTTANTIAIQLTGGNAGGIKAAYDTSAGAVGDIIDLGGTDLANSGLLVTADGTLQVVYTAVGGGGAAIPQIRINIYIAEKEART